MKDEIVVLERRWMGVGEPRANWSGPPILLFHLVGSESAETIAGETTRGFEPVATPWSALTGYLQCPLCLTAHARALRS
jgi:hypothetical protein